MATKFKNVTISKWVHLAKNLAKGIFKNVTVFTSVSPTPTIDTANGTVSAGYFTMDGADTTSSKKYLSVWNKRAGESFNLSGSIGISASCPYDKCSVSIYTYDTAWGGDEVKPTINGVDATGTKNYTITKSAPLKLSVYIHINNQNHWQCGANFEIQSATFS